MASNFSPMYFEQSIVIFDTTQPLNSTSGSFVSYGGVRINAEYESTDTSSGAFLLSGGMAVQKKLNVGGITNISNITQSEGTGSGALVVAGGAGIAKNLHVGQDTFIAGNLYVNGLTTSVNSTTINVSDNTFTLNSGPAGSRDAGILIQRYQTAVDDGSGDVVAAAEPYALDSTFTLGGTNSVQFATTDNTLNVDTWWIKVTSGVATDQVRKISSATNIAGTVTLTLATVFTNAVTTGDSFKLYNRNFVAQYYDEPTDEYILGYVADASDIQEHLKGTGLLNVRMKGLYATNSTITNLEVTSLSAGNIGLDQATILNTFVVTGTTTLASLMVSGGSQVGGTLTVTGASVFNAGATTGALFVTGGSLLEGSLGVSGATLLGSDLTVTGASVFNAGATTGALFVTGGSLLEGSLGVSGATLLGSDLTVTGASVFNAGATTGALFVTGGSLLEGSLGVSGATLLGSDLTVTGASVFNAGVTTGALFVTGGSLLEGSLGVSGASIMQDNLTVTTGSVTISTNDYTPIIGATSATGGSILFNTVDVSPSMGDISRERSFVAANNVSSASNITGFVFSNAVVRAFDAVVSVTIIDGGSNKYAYYNLKGIQKGSNWVLNSSYVGDATGFTFSITNSGQIQYTSTDVAGYDSSYVNFRAMTTTIN